MVRNGIPVVPPLSQLRHEMDRLFEDFFGPVAARAGVRLGSFPAVNLWELDNELVAEAELPGVKSYDVEITVVGSELTIKGKRPAENDAGIKVLRRERATGEFSRVIHLPVEVDPTKVDASMVEGVLRIHLPKSDSVRPHKVPVRTPGQA